MHASASIEHELSRVSKQICINVNKSTTSMAPGYAYYRRDVPPDGNCCISALLIKACPGFGGPEHDAAAASRFRELLYAWLEDYGITSTDSIGKLRATALEADASTAIENRRTDFFEPNLKVINAVRTAVADFYRHAAAYLESIPCDEHGRIPITLEDHEKSDKHPWPTHLQLAYKTLHFMARLPWMRDWYTAFKSNDPSRHKEHSPTQTAAALRARAQQFDPDTPGFDASMDTAWLADVPDLQVIMFMVDYQHVATQLVPREASGDTFSPCVILWTFSHDKLKLVPSDFHLRVGRSSSADFCNHTGNVLERVNPSNVLDVPIDAPSSTESTNEFYRLQEDIWFKISVLLHHKSLLIIEYVNNNHYRTITPEGSIP